MSDDEHSSEETPINKLLGNLVMIAIPLGLVLMLGVTGVAFVSGMAPEPVDEEIAEAAPAEDPGKKAYATCAACHGPDGKGLKAGAALMAPSLIGSEVLLGDPEESILVILKGIKKENFDYMGVMAALGALPDDDIAAVLTYLRTLGENSAPAVTVEEVAAARAKFADVNEPAGVPRGKIKEIVEAHK